MWVVEQAPISDRSVMPSGGSPSDDLAYESWRNGFLNVVADRWVLARWHLSFDLTLRLQTWQFDDLLYAQLEPAGLFPSLPPLRRHRLRSLAIHYRTRQRAVQALADRIITEVFADGVHRSQ